MILLIDNYDSFVYNLSRYFRRLGHRTLVIRNDAIGVPEIRRLGPAAIVLSPGPRTPFEAGCCLDVVRAFSGRTPLLGVCLGHQAIAVACGAALERAPVPMHGRTSPIVHDGRGLFHGLPHPLTVGRYHSLVVARHTLPACLEVSARTLDGVIMSVRHREAPTWGVQFHPESILTDAGYALLANFLQLASLREREARSPAGELAEPPTETPRLPTAPVTF